MTGSAASAEFSDYASWYLAAARRLSLEARTDLTVPTVYLYRHALELALKNSNVWTEAVIEIRAELGLIPKSDVRTRDEVARELHDHQVRRLLLRLTRRIDKIRMKSGGPAIDDILREVSPATEALTGLDVDGQALRYPYPVMGKSKSWEQPAPSLAVLPAAVFEDVGRGVDFLLHDLAAWLESSFEEGIEDLTLAGWAAEWKARTEAENAWRMWEVHSGGGHAEALDDLKHETSAETFELEGIDGR